MSIQSEITRLSDNISSAYSAVSAKGGTLPATQNSQNLAGAIQSISSGGSSYTAGNGIEISDDNVISTKNIGSFGGQLLMSLVEPRNSPSFYNKVRVSSVEDFVANVRAGFIVNPTKALTISIADLIEGQKDAITYLNVIRIESKTNITVLHYEISGTITTIGVGSSYQYVMSGDTMLILKQTVYTGEAILNNLYYDKTSSGLTATTIKGAIDELVSTRIADSLVSTETTPTVNNTINWVYE